MCYKATILLFPHIAFNSPFFFYIIAWQLKPMAQKIIGIYNDAQDTTGNHQLIIEIGNSQVACMIKNMESQKVEELEVFGIEKDSSDWSDIFYEVKAASQILNRLFRDTLCFYNFEEAIIMPEEKFSATAAEDYLSLIYGETSRHEIKYDNILPGSNMVNAYRVRKSIHELVGRHFLLYKPHHTYSRILDDILHRDQLDNHFLKIQFYSHHFILVLVKDKKLQLIQSFQYQTDNDVLYYVLSLIKQYGINNDHSNLEVSGMYDPGSSLHQQFVKLFGRISFDTIQVEGVFASAMAGYPAHYFTPFYKLAV